MDKVIFIGVISIIAVLLLIVHYGFKMELFVRKVANQPKTKWHFSTIDKTIIGDMYKYEVEANSQEEAAQILFNFFHGKKPYSDKVKSDHCIVTWSGGYEARPYSNEIFSDSEGIKFAASISSGPYWHWSKKEVAEFWAWKEQRLKEWSTNPEQHDKNDNLGQTEVSETQKSL